MLIVKSTAKKQKWPNIWFLVAFSHCECNHQRNYEFEGKKILFDFNFDFPFHSSPRRVGYFRSTIDVYVEQVAKYRLNDNMLVVVAVTLWRHIEHRESFTWPYFSSWHHRERNERICDPSISYLSPSGREDIHLVAHCLPLSPSYVSVWINKEVWVGVGQIDPEGSGSLPKTVKPSRAVSQIPRDQSRLPPKTSW